MIAIKEVYRATGRRKRAIARVILKPGSGKRLINGRIFKDYFNNPVTERNIEQPFAALECGEKWDISANVTGGGISGQAGAIRLGIARALLLQDEENRKSLRAGGFLTRDSRVVQRKIYGRAKARKRYQFSKR